MGHEKLSFSSYPWPRYFRPLAGEEGKPVLEQERMPVSVLDVFYVQREKTAATHLVAVVGCLGGSLDIAKEATWSTLPGPLGEQIDALHASSRGKFKSIVGSNVDIFSLEAMEQKLQAPGFNDAVSLYCTSHARIAFTGEDIQIDRLANRGMLSVGRLDLLRACQVGFNTVFHNPRSERGEVVGFFVPTAGPNEVKEGKGVGLVYPLIDSGEAESSGNTIIAKRITYEVLMAMQRDLVETQPRHSFANREIPVPNRKTLEWELEADGYKIQGEMATRIAQAQQGAGDTRLLVMLRQLRNNWNAQTMQLPPQAKEGEYGQMIQQVLKEFAAPEDTQFHEILNSRLVLEAKAVAAKPQILPTIQAEAPQPRRRASTRKPDVVSTSEPTPAPAPKISSTGKRRIASSGPARESSQAWSGSFDDVQKPDSKASTWWGDFQGANKTGREVLSSNLQDWSEPTRPTKKKNSSSTPPAETWNGEFK